MHREGKCAGLGTGVASNSLHTAKPTLTKIRIRMDLSWAQQSSAEKPADRPQVLSARRGSPRGIANNDMRTGRSLTPDSDSR